MNLPIPNTRSFPELSIDLGINNSYWGWQGLSRRTSVSFPLHLRWLTTDNISRLLSIFKLPYFMTPWRKHFPNSEQRNWDIHLETESCCSFCVCVCVCFVGHLTVIIFYNFRVSMCREMGLLRKTRLNQISSSLINILILSWEVHLTGRFFWLKASEISFLFFKGNIYLSMVSSIISKILPFQGTLKDAWFFTELGQIISQFIWKHKKTLSSQNNIEKEEWNWRNQPAWLQTLLQSHSHQDSMVLAQRQKYRSVEQNRKAQR